MTDHPLYLSDLDIGKLLLGQVRCREFVELAKLLEREGLPPVDKLFAGRYWPAVKRYFDAKNGLFDHGTPAGETPVSHLEDFSLWRKPKKPRRA